MTPVSLDGGVRVPSPRVPESVAVATETVEAAEILAAPPAVRSFGDWLRVWGLYLEWILCALVGLGVGLLGNSTPAVVLITLGIWAISNFHPGRSLTSPLTRQVKAVVDSTLLPLAVVGAAVGFLGLPNEVLPQTFTAVIAAASMSIVCRVLRWRLQSPVRTVVVGDRVAIAKAAARWGRNRKVSVVGALLMEPDLYDDEIPTEILGVQVLPGLDDVAARVRRWSADLVVVSPLPDFTAYDFRRLAWSLEETRVSLGVGGVLDSVSPQRITPGGLERATIMAVRPPMPSPWVRGVKAFADRLAGVLLLALVSPILALIMLAVRFSDPGPALFSQVRVGRHGVPFKVFKIRTMVQNADQIKAQLADENESDGVLFKMRRDPRVTSIGRFLRKSSLDELPQLINVIRGEMSLVGPRPHLPEEIASMDHDQLRRLAVRPGITGLWQVSGRSDLSGDETAELDTYYADNWSLVGDVGIGLRTIKAVVSTKGAY